MWVLGDGGLVAAENHDTLRTLVQSQVTKLSIAKFAETGGVGVETVRFYQRKGLLPVPAASAGMRRYGETELRQLRFIRMAQRAGFTLQEIRELIALDSSDDRRRARELAAARVAKLDQQIAELQQARDCLRQLARQCTDGAPGPCPILAAFDPGPASV